MLLEAKGVSKAFGSFFAVRHADLTVAEGEIIGLIGPNGAGKSTFFNCLAGDAVPTAGTVSFDGVDLTHASPDLHGTANPRRTHETGRDQEERASPGLAGAGQCVVCRGQTVWTGHFLAK